MESRIQRTWLQLFVSLIEREGGGFEETITPTDDGGMIIEFMYPTGRDLFFAIPDDISRLYFTARGPGEFRIAGIVVVMKALLSLTSWAKGEVNEIYEAGLDIAKGLEKGP